MTKHSESRLDDGNVTIYFLDLLYSYVDIPLLVVWSCK